MSVSSQLILSYDVSVWICLIVLVFREYKKAELVGQLNIIGKIKTHRFRWSGHLEKMGEDRNVKRAYLGRPTSRRPVGRPRYRWSNAVEVDLRQLARGCSEPKEWHHLRRLRHIFGLKVSAVSKHREYNLFTIHFLS